MLVVVCVCCCVAFPRAVSRPYTGNYTSPSGVLTRTSKCGYLIRRMLFSISSRLMGYNVQSLVLRDLNVAGTRVLASNLAVKHRGVKRLVFLIMS